MVVQNKPSTKEQLFFKLSKAKCLHRSFGLWYKERTELRFSGTVVFGTEDQITGNQSQSPAVFVNSFEPNNSDASVSLGSCTWCQFKFIYFSGTNVNYTAIKQARPVFPYKMSNLNITFN